MFNVKSKLTYGLGKNGNHSNRQVLSDGFGRQAKKLKISVADRGNLRSAYSLPENPNWELHREILTYEEISLLVGIFVKRLGIESLRITGGEPLVRKDLHYLIEKLALLKSPYPLIQKLALLKSPYPIRLSLSTNGVWLKYLSSYLKEAGLDDVNVSLDSLDPDKFLEIESPPFVMGSTQNTGRMQIEKVS